MYGICFVSAAAAVVRAHIQSAGHERLGVARLPRGITVHGDPRSLYIGKAQDTVQRVDIQHLLAEHGGKRRGGQAEGDSIGAGGDHSRDELSPTAAESADRSTQARRASGRER